VSSYEHGRKHGPAKEERTTGEVEERVYVDGVLSGPSKMTWPTGDTLEFNYEKGKR